MNLNSKESLFARVRRSKAARKQFIESNITKTIANQIRATRDRLGWSQERLAQEAGMNQNAISRLESSDYGKATLTTLKRLAASMDIGLIVRFVPFSEMVDWVSGTPRVIEGLTTSALAVANFDQEENEGVFGRYGRGRIKEAGLLGTGAAAASCDVDRLEQTQPFELYPRSSGAAAEARVL